MDLVIDRQGTAHCIYTETIDLSCLGALSMRRASYVEPDAHLQWWADLAPVNGPQLGPFDRRSVALAAEQQWLETHWLTDLRHCRPATSASAATS